MSTAIAGLLFGWNKNAEYGPKLVADLSDQQLVAQPALTGQPPVNHPAWIFSHLNAYLPVIEAIIAGQEFEDPKEHPFGMLSQPAADRSIYALKDELVARFTTGHQRITELLQSADDAMLDQTINLPRWKSIMPTAGIALPYLMLNHENLHLGQLSAWRRVQGMPSV
jgi:hypothetical protein